MHREIRTVAVIFVTLWVTAAMSVPVRADESVFSVPLEQQPSGAFYVRGTLAADVETDLLVDTGSTYVVLSLETFKALEKAGDALFKRHIHGATASGRRLKAKVYEISALAIGDRCVLEAVEAVVLPGSDRDILGLSALKRVQPFTFDLDPLALRFERCGHPESEGLLASSALTDGQARTGD